MATLTPEAIRDAVFNAASENSDLLNTLAKTSEAPSLYAAHLIHLDRLETSLTEQNSVLDSLKTQTDIKFKSHKKLRDSVTKKWFYRATKMLAKFEAKAMSEEREYFAALGTQSKAEERCDILKTEVERAKEDKLELEKVAKAHGDTHQKIDKLYERLFKGPTPGFGDEDERESTFYKSEEGNENVKEWIKKARKAKNGLGVVKTYVGRAKGNFSYAHTSAEENRFFLDQATYYVDRGDNAVRLALEALKKTDEHLFPLSQDMMGKHRVLMSSLESARIQESRSYPRAGLFAAIEASQRNLSDAEARLEQLIEHAKEVEKAGLAKLKETARRLEDSRQELQQIRQGIFERVAGFGEAAPAYNECCDRADRFCDVPDVGHEHVQPEEEAASPAAPAEGERAQPPGYEQEATQGPSRFGLADVLREDRDA
ncbi:uncharacterized protein PAC_18176 [Phialocephala subalpina]|uniref:Uncharacterized protein n=1 Tax=Phialocephala subalpina TaxID=576137 RepID=A0A1L7XTI4_9HELO|nr:uncharacterized protein PAC_18176 [Phialocephala subalpina]